MISSKCGQVNQRENPTSQQTDSRRSGQKPDGASDRQRSADKRKVKAGKRSERQFEDRADQAANDQQPVHPMAHRRAPSDARTADDSIRCSCIQRLWWRPLLTRGWGWPEEQSLAAAFLDKKLTCVSW